MTTRNGMQQFIQVGSVNTKHSNLTELNATDSINNGFMQHSDWLAHAMRYAIVSTYVKSSTVQSILDVGCGHLQMLRYMWRNRVPLDGIRYVGLDLRARRQWLEEDLPTTPDVTLIQMDIIADVTEHIEPADIVVCTEMLEHIDKNQAQILIKRLRSWIKPNGTLFLSSPNLGGSPTVADNHTGPHGEPREWSYDGKVQLLTRNGFDVIDSLGTFIRLDHIPDRFWTDETLAIKQHLPNAFFRCFAAAAFPAESNNAMFICKPV